MLTSQMIKEAALAAGADLCGIGNMERFEGAPPDMDPRYLFPEAKSVIGFAFRIPRGVQRGIEEGTQFYQYPSMAYGGINEIYAPAVLYRVGKLLEDEGYEAFLYRNTGARGRVSDTAGDAMADRLIQYLRKHYRENLTVEQIATHFNYHAGHINRVMRRSTGTTIHNYLVRCRMDAAKTLLLSTDVTVSQVAEEVGIESEAYFCNSFKKLTGISPKEYRRRAKNQ